MYHRNGVILRYFISYKKTKANTQFQVITKDVDPSEIYEDDDIVAILISNLNKFTQYTVNVKAFTKAGMGPASTEIQVFTLEDGKEFIESCINTKYFGCIGQAPRSLNLSHVKIY